MLDFSHVLELSTKKNRKEANCLSLSAILVDEEGFNTEQSISQVLSALNPSIKFLFENVASMRAKDCDVVRVRNFERFLATVQCLTRS